MGFFAAGFSYAIQFFEQRPRELWMCLALPAFAGFLGDIIVDPGPDEISSIIKVFLAVVAAFLLHLTICWCAGDYTPHEHTPINRDVLGGMN